MLQHTYWLPASSQSQPVRQADCGSLPCLDSAPYHSQTSFSHRRRYAPPLLSHWPYTSPSSHPHLPLLMSYDVMASRQYSSILDDLYVLPSSQYPGNQHLPIPSPLLHGATLLKGSGHGCSPQWWPCYAPSHFHHPHQWVASCQSATGYPSYTASSQDHAPSHGSLLTMAPQ